MLFDVMKRESVGTLELIIAMAMMGFVAILVRWERVLGLII